MTVRQLSAGALVRWVRHKRLCQTALGEPVPRCIGGGSRDCKVIGPLRAIGDGLEIVKEEARQRKRVYFRGHATDMALVHPRVGDREQAFEWLEKVYEAREPSLLWLKVATDGQSGSDRRFTNLLRRVNFPM